MLLTCGKAAAQSAVTEKPAAPGYIGRQACTACHAKEAEAWRGSHHDLAMQEPTSVTVLGDFSGTSFKSHGIVSRFFKRGDTFYVNTDGPDGKLADFPIKYVFGVTPLQQYLVEFSGGRLQALSIAWDSRPKSAGGQRWFHLFAKEKIDHKDSLHWTGIYQNWNLQCAECHSTGLRKGYDAATNSYHTNWRELNVSCEACHGPGSRHADWAKTATKPYKVDDNNGFAYSTASRWKDAWRFPEAGARTARRDRLAAPAVSNTCAACHARRSTIAARDQPGAPLADTHRLALLTAPNYHADGQQREEVYTWGSFLQSKMFQQGVTCMDCHEPHGAKTRAPGNALCLRCHDAAIFDSPQHHFHKTGEAGAQCVACHMPTQNYMVIDARHDHSLRVPRPDLAQKLGSPDACTQCHADKKPAWAAAALDGWLGRQWRQRPNSGPVLHAGTTQGVKAAPSLLALAQSSAQPPLVRATAAQLLVPHMRPSLLQSARELLKDPDPEVRIAVLGMIEPVDPINRVLAASPLLTDSVRGVRIEAARVLAGVPETRLPDSRREAYRRALDEYIVVQQEDADWPTANLNMGNLYLRLGRFDEAVAAYRRALKLDPQFASAWVNLADAWRVQGREIEAETTLRAGLVKLPRSADLLHALGLTQVRKGDKTAALESLAQAARLAPERSRYAYVWAVALHSAGRSDEALKALREADKRHPYDVSLLGTLVSIERETGDAHAALAHARKLAEALPDDPQVKALVAELSRGK
ncbi:putative CXXCH cytochrome family protein [Sulfurisoma sediminicola]|uniref:Putative CXXCH cytochrome family protein n=1 Tax=Sulfurisoma sediminicola TaxID=1381557 RepID=A0A497XKD6_9PROT|nr:putative CXXCH cytochrome family protein [Sulfurisoma sediminicola]